MSSRPGAEHRAVPRVSVIVPAYNQAQYLGQAIDSVLGQTYGDLELVVVDDGSTDGTADVVRLRLDPRLRYMQQDNQGLSAARNSGIRVASGAWLSFLDADDLFLPEKLSALLEIAQAHPGTGLAAGQAIPIDENGQPVGAIFDEGPPARTEDWLLANPLHVGSVILSRRWQETVGWFDVTLRSYEDWDFWLRLAIAGCPMAWLPRPVSLYRFHRGQMIRDGRRMTEANLSVLEKVFGEPGLPASWQENRRRAYSRAHLRTAANAYSSSDPSAGNAALLEAVELDPELLEDGGLRLRNMFYSWSEFPKTTDRLALLERLHAHLPGELRSVFTREDLAEGLLRVGIEAYQRGDRRTARSALWKGIRLDPRRVQNRGLVSLFARTLAPVSRPRRHAGAH